MKKIFLFFLIYFSVYYHLSGQTITAVANYPLEVPSGRSFDVTVELNKLDLTSYGELRICMPKYFSAFEKNSAGARYSFKDQILTYTWPIMPHDQKLLVTFSVHVDTMAKGSYNLAGDFFYQYQNRRGVARINPQTIVVKKEAVYVYNNPNLPINTQSCVRQKTSFNDTEKAFFVSLRITKGNYIGIGKIIEEIPAGYNISVIDGQGAIVESKQGSTEFTWNAMPVTAEFTILYKLIPTDLSKRLPPDYQGKFMIMVDYNVKTFIITEQLLNRTNSQQQNINNQPVNNSRNGNQEVENYFRNN